MVEVTEVDAAGSVPELLVINRSKRAVLIIDGEEVVGAKQNCAVNTSLLLPAESGSWAEVSEQFKKSGTVLHHKARARKAQSVSTSYLMCETPVSN